MNATDLLELTAATVTPAAIRQAVNAWLDANWSPDLPLRVWRQRLIDGGWSWE